tara:strand:- start:1523 stop:1753 length:231 start_codon:yes stop_codon:yes gene_type:complete
MEFLLTKNHKNCSIKRRSSLINTIQINEWSNDTNRIKDDVKVPDGFVYSGDSNAHWVTKNDLQTWVDANINYVGNI